MAGNNHRNHHGKRRSTTGNPIQPDVLELEQAPSKKYNQEGARMDKEEYLQACDCESLTGTPASTWRYWAHIGSGPPSFKIGRRRVWKKSVLMAWLADLESATTRGGVA